MVVSLISSGLLFLSWGSSFACLGARPLSMGGAFVAVADDIHSCYWNPAGLGNIAPFEITAMKTINNQYNTNYQKWAATGLRVGNGGIGVSYVNAINYLSGTNTNYYVSDEEWLTFSIGGYGVGIFSNTAFGLNYRQQKHVLKSGSLTTLYLTGNPNYKVTGYEDTISAMDLGLLHKINENFTLGLLVQDINEPEVDLGKLVTKNKYICNIRPGVAWRPNKKTIVAMDIYNLTLDNEYDLDAKGQSEVRLGFERWCSDKIAIRAGFYGRSFHTFGIGLNGNIPGFKGISYQIDYALLEGDGSGTHLVSLGAKF